MPDHKKFDEMVAYAREDDGNVFAPPVELICADCDHPLVFTGSNPHVGWIECRGCGLAYTARNNTMVVVPRPAASLTNLTEDGTHVVDPSKPVVLPPELMSNDTVKQMYADAGIAREMIEWALEKGRLEAEISMPRPGANIESLEMHYRQWLKDNPQPAVLAKKDPIK